jgi:hypothetical protein
MRLLSMRTLTIHAVYRLADDVPYHYVHLLNARRVGGGRYYVYIANFVHNPAAFSAEPYASAAYLAS